MYLFVLQLFPQTFDNLPNLHISRHLVTHAQNYGTLLNTAVAVKEMVHRIFKGMVPHTNLKNVEFDLVQKYNTLQAFHYILDGGTDHQFSEHSGRFRTLISNDCVGKILK